MCIICLRVFVVLVLKIRSQPCLRYLSFGSQDKVFAMLEVFELLTALPVAKIVRPLMQYAMNLVTPKFRLDLKY